MPRYLVSRTEEITVEADDEQEALAVADERLDIGGASVIVMHNVEQLLTRAETDPCD